ncbi:MAG TPA: peptidoglycan-associated lipoprotein Pal [Gemmatimonadaceae bacterium]|jgi:peptidoglycan-associated lipoprotein
MISSSRIAGLSLAVVSVFALAACHKKPDVSPEPTTRTGTPVTTTTVTGPNADSIRRAEEEDARRRAEEANRRRADSIAAAEAALRNAGASRAALTATIHFDYDQADLRAEDRAILDAKVPILQANPGVTIQIQGHTDERGSDEYNLALGQRRAATVKRYLLDRGVADARMQTITYGEERPVAQGHDEGAYAQNRRAEFEITAGGQTLRARP